MNELFSQNIKILLFYTDVELNTVQLQRSAYNHSVLFVTS